MNEREKVAAAICEALAVADRPVWPLLSEYDRKQYLRAADAVIALQKASAA